MTLALDIAILALLLATCAYCVYLSRRLAALRAAHAEFGETLSQFDEASRRAEQALAGIQAAGLTMNDDLAARGARAEALIDELSVMVSAGDAVAARLENAVADVKRVGARKRPA